MHNQKRLINKATKNYKETVDSHFNTSFKATQIGYWLETHSRHIKDDCTKNLHGKYVYYKPGSIIMVDFGVNVGSELSGSHFAITLSKRDSAFKPTTTVIPLSSKPKSWYINIGNEV